MIDETRLKTLKIEQHLLTVRHIKQLEKEIENLMKQKAELQDQIDAFNKEKHVSIELQSNLMEIENANNDR